MVGYAGPMLTLDVIEEAGSTSDLLRERAGQDGPEGAVMARVQTRGRGRLGRHWRSLPGNLALSVLLRPGAPVRPGHWSLLAGVALAEAAAEALDGLGVLRLKWPNDLLLDGGKLAGILLEAGESASPWLVMGFGVNLVAAPADLGRATACISAVRPPPEPEAFARIVLDRVADWRVRYERAGFAPVREAWLARGPAPGSAMTVAAGAQRISGVLHGLGADGSLLVDTGTGVVSVAAGEVE